MADLVTLAEFDAWLGGAVTAENTMRQAILDQIEAAFDAACGRAEVPFTAAETGRVEVRAGTGSRTLFLDYPIAAVTEVLLGFDASSPIESLDPTDAAVLIFTVGDTQLTRVDGGKFGCLGDPAYVQITYDTQDDLPSDAKLAILSEATAAYHRRGSEGVKSETMGPYSVTFRDDTQATRSQFWLDAVDAHRRIRL